MNSDAPVIPRVEHGGQSGGDSTPAPSRLSVVEVVG